MTAKDQNQSAHPVRGIAVLSDSEAFLSDMIYSNDCLPIIHQSTRHQSNDNSLVGTLSQFDNDHSVTAVCLQLEQLRAVKSLSEWALSAHQRGIPVVAVFHPELNSQEPSPTPSAAALSSETLATSLFRRFGFIEVDTVDEALQTLKMLILAAPPRGPRIALASSAAAYSSMATKLIRENRLSLPSLSSKTSAALSALTREPWHPEKTLLVDISRANQTAESAQLFSTFIDDDFDLALLVASFHRETDTTALFKQVQQYATAAEAAKLPMVVISPTPQGMPREANARLIELGVAPLRGIESGIKVIALVLQWHLHRKKIIAAGLLLDEPPKASTARAGQLDEIESKALLAAFGLQTPKGQRWLPGKPAPADIRFPVVLKVCNASVYPNSDLGETITHLSSPERLNFAADTMRANYQSHGHEIYDFLVEEQIHAVVSKLSIAIDRIAEIGFALTISAMDEAHSQPPESVTLLLPCDRATIQASIKNFRHGSISVNAFDGLTGSLDKTLNVIEVITAFVQSRSDIVSLEIRPLLLLATGQAAVAAQAKIKILTQ